MVTHAAEVADHAHRIVEMRDGAIVDERSPDPADPASTASAAPATAVGG